MPPPPLKTRHRWTFWRGYARDSLKHSFWWNLVVWGIISSLIILLAHAAFGSSDARRSAPPPAPALRWVAAPATISQPVSFAGKKKGSGLTVRRFHRNFLAGRYGHWPRNSPRFNRSFRAAWIASANRHLRNRARSHRYYSAMIRTTSCQTEMGNLPNCHMKFPSVRYDWRHPADPNTKWVLRVAWCGTVAVTEYYTRGEATKTLRAIGGKAMGLCLPAFLIP